MTKKRERAFTMGDDPMLERGRVFHDQLNGELADFTSRFPWLDAAWLAAFLADIDAADAFPKDESIILDIKVLTGDVTASMQQGYAALQTLGGYAKLAYPTDAARERVFGQQYWYGARDNTLKLQEALELAYAKADNAAYKPDLLAKGYTQAEIDQLDTLASDLQTKNGLQEALKVGRHVTKHDRIALLNVVWSHMQTINVCASVVWAADAERMGQYQLYPSGSSSSTKGSIGGTVTADGGGPINGALVAIDVLSKDTTTDSSGNYSFANVEEGSYQLDFTADGYEAQSVDAVVVVAGETEVVDVTLTAMAGGGTATVSGTVLDNGTLTPINNATVRIINPEGSVTTTTNASGEYVLLLNEMAGPVGGTLEAEAAGYTLDSRPITVNPDDELTENFNLNAMP